MVARAAPCRSSPHSYTARRSSTLSLIHIFNRLPESERRESEIVGFLGGLGAVSGNAIADEPSTDGVGVGVDSDIATEPAPAQRGDTATWHCVSIDGEPRNWITRPVLADMDELSIIVEEG